MILLKKLSFLLALLLLLTACTGDPGQTPGGPCAAHTDSDDNGLCDVCTESLMVSIDIFCINDLHGKILDGESQPGVDELTTFLAEAKEENPNTILLSAGDMWQGSSESNLTRGNLTTEWMNEAGFDAMTLGNHEFDWGLDPIADNAELAQFPLLAINVYDADTRQRVSYCQSSVMVECSGVQVGIIGAIGDCYSSIAADKSEGVYFLVGDELTELVKAESEALRSQGADLIVYTLHDGYGRSESANVTTVSGGTLKSYYDVALSDGYVDLVFEGHTHQRYLLRDQHNVYHMQNKGENRGISQAMVRINSVTGTHRITSNLVSNGTYAFRESDPIVEELLEKYNEQVAPALEVLGTNRQERSSWELKQKVADLYYELGMEVWGDEYDIVLGGGFISVRNPYNLAAGEVTYGMVQSLLPFDNTLGLCAIRGQDLEDKFFYPNNDNYYITFGKYGEKVRKKIDPDAMYYIVIDSYSYTYAPNNVTLVEEYKDGIYARDLMAQFIRDGGYE